MDDYEHADSKGRPGIHHPYDTISRLEAAEDRETVSYRANIAKLRELAHDADLKGAEHVATGHHTEAAHWFGFRAGLLRAINVLEGRG